MIVKSAILFNNIVYTGCRHHNILQNAEEYGLGFGGLKTGVQGFVTDKNEFLNREEAREHFIKSNQIPFMNELLHGEMLFSEDLY